MERIKEIIDNAKNNGVMDKDIEALITSYNNYIEDMGELNESLFGYMSAFVLNNEIDKMMYKDEIENMLGINSHDEILNIIV